MKISAVYKIQSKIKPEKVYIGSAVDMKSRRSIHLFDLRNNKHHSSKLQNHYNKYGENDLIFSVIEPCFREFLTIREQYYIDALKPFFNSRPKAESQLGYKHSDKAKELMSIARTKRVMTPETCKKISEALKGKNTWSKGCSHSIKTRRKMSISAKGHKGCVHSEESKQKNRIAHLGKRFSVGKRTPEFCKNISEKLKGKKRPEEFKQSVSRGITKWWANRKNAV